jgi:NADH dehydrogenase
MADVHAVTGAFSYTGAYITRRLLDRGVHVRTLTNHPRQDHELFGRVDVHPLRFDDTDRLAESLSGASVLYNTYWIRFPHGTMTYDGAVANTRALIAAAERAGVRRIVHVSIAHADPASSLPYYRGKGELEGAVRASAMSHAILRPTVIYGQEDVLINNIAWLLRRFPVFAVPGDGRYRLQPVFVDDLAALAVDCAMRDEDLTIDAVGPETYTFDELVKLLARAMGQRARLVRLPPRLALLASRVIGYGLRDVVLTADEVRGLMAGLLATESAPVGSTLLSHWLGEHGSSFGRRYASELARHYR